jgi:predicted O-methyltransferase YrrM
MENLMQRPVEALYRKYATHAHALHRSDATAHDVLALQELTPLGGGPLPWTEFSMRPAVISAIVADVIINERQDIFECGSGNSTVFVARLLQRLGEGHMVSFDHDGKWAALTTRLLAREGLEDFATVIHAPLVNGWYGIATLEPDGIDLLIVDGPTSRVTETGQDRYPALPCFFDKLAPGATVFLDDAQRPGEQAVIERWECEYPLRFTQRLGSFATATKPIGPSPGIAAGSARRGAGTPRRPPRSRAR